MTAFLLLGGIDSFGSRYCLARINRGFHFTEYGIEGIETQHNIGFTRGFAHQTNAPDFTCHRAKPGTDFKIVVLQ